MNRTTVVVFVMLALGLATAVAAQGAPPTVAYKVIRTIPHSSTYTGGLAFERGPQGADVLYVGGSFSNVIEKRDPYTGTQIGTITAPNSKVRDLTYDGRNLWMASWYKAPTPSIFMLNPANGAVMGTFKAPFTKGYSNGMAWDGNDLWIGEEGGQIYKVDPVKWVVLGTIAWTFGGSSNPRGLGHDWATGTVWAGNQSTGEIVGFDTATGKATGKLVTPYSYPQGVAHDGWFLWVTGGQTPQTVSQIDVTPPFMVMQGKLKAGTQFRFKLTQATTQVGNLFLVAWSGSGTGPYRIAGKLVPLTFDNFTLAGLALSTYFQSVIDSTGAANTLPFTWPKVPAGLPIWVCGLTLDTKGIVSVTEPQKYVSQ